jgi:hypothetical protein
MRHLICLVVMLMAGTDIVAQSHDKPGATPTKTVAPTPGKAAPHAPPAAPAKAVTGGASPAPTKAPTAAHPGAEAKTMPVISVTSTDGSADMIRVAKAMAAALAAFPAQRAAVVAPPVRRPQVALPVRRTTPQYPVRWPTVDARWEVPWPGAEEFRVTWPSDLSEGAAPLLSWSETP